MKLTKHYGYRIYDPNKVAPLDRKVLLLNFSYEPLNIMTVKRAMIKLLKENSPYVVELWSDIHIRTAHTKFPVPSVVRRIEWLDIRKRKNKSGARRIKIYIRDKWKCGYCEKKLTNANAPITLDHIIPKSRGGTNTPDNLVTSCKECNNRKGDRTPKEARMKLHVSRSTLRAHIDSLNLRNLDEHHPEWADYLFKGKGDKKLMHTDD